MKDEKSSGGSRDEPTGCQHNLWGARTLLMKGLETETVRNCVQFSFILLYSSQFNSILCNIAGKHRTLGYAQEPIM